MRRGDGWSLGTELRTYQHLTCKCEVRSGKRSPICWHKTLLVHCGLVDAAPVGADGPSSNCGNIFRNIQCHNTAWVVTKVSYFHHISFRPSSFHLPYVSPPVFNCTFFLYDCAHGKNTLFSYCLCSCIVHPCVSVPLHPVVSCPLTVVLCCRCTRPHRATSWSLQRRGDVTHPVIRGATVAPCLQMSRGQCWCPRRRLWFMYTEKCRRYGTAMWPTRRCRLTWPM
jgi:hypothetical protein